MKTLIISRDVTKGTWEQYGREWVTQKPEAPTEDDSCSDQLQSDRDWLPMDSEDDGPFLYPPAAATAGSGARAAGIRR